MSLRNLIVDAWVSAIIKWQKTPVSKLRRVQIDFRMEVDGQSSFISYSFAVYLHSTRWTIVRYCWISTDSSIIKIEYGSIFGRPLFFSNESTSKSLHLNRETIKRIFITWISAHFENLLSTFLRLFFFSLLLLLRYGRKENWKQWNKAKV